MVGSTKAELASSSLDGPAFVAGYPSVLRSSYSAPSLERSGSFRDSLENRLMISASSVSRNVSPTLEIPPLPHYLSLEPFSTTELNLKYSRQGELRRALGVSVEEHSFGSLQSKPLPPIASEELKRFKASVLDTSTRARDRAKLLQESILKLDKFRNIVAKRRQRNEVQSHEKPGISNSLKTGNQIHQINSDIAGARTEERTKLAIPNRRARSSMIESDGRSTIPARQGAALDKDKNLFFEKDKSILRACNGGSISSEDKIRGLPTGGDGWEKKLKRKRSVGTMVTRNPDGDRELKQTVQSRPTTEPRPRPSDGNGFRTGSTNGIIGSSKIENNSQIFGNSSRVMPRTEIENASFSTDRRDRMIGLDKERMLAKGSKKINNREDAQSGSQSPVAKGKASRAPRTVSGNLVSSSNYPRLSGSIEGWEQPPCLNKVQFLSNAANRKRPLPTGSSSSPPVTQWVGQRPQKISRTRRANVVSPVSNFDEVQAFPEAFTVPDVVARLPSVDSVGALNSRVVANGSHQLKFRLDNALSPAGLSESEESGAVENKREKGVDSGEMEDEHPNGPLKMPDFNLPTKRNKVRPKDEIGDGVWRQGRSGRCSTQLKASLPLLKEKPESVDIIKPLKNGRPASDRTESRVGRPPSKKVSDRKAYGRPLPSINCSSSDIIGEAHDDRDELMAAANAARNSSYSACSSSFWKTMETSFAFVSSEDLTFVKHQMKFAEELDENLATMHNGKVLSGADSALHSYSSAEQANQTNLLGINSSIETIDVAGEQQFRKTESDSWFDKIIPLSQRLLSALIVEDGTEIFSCKSEQDELFLQFSSDCSIGTNCYLENEFESAGIKSDFLDLEFVSQKFCAPSSKSCNGFAANGNIMTSVIQASISGTGSDLFLENGVSEQISTGVFPEYDHCNSQLLQFASTNLTSNSPYEGQFEHMPLNDRILLELHSIGIYPDLVPDLAEGEDEEIDKVISELKIKFFQQAKMRKNQLYKLERSLEGVKEDQERNLEQLAMHKLVEIAYKKLLGGRGSHGLCHKNAVSKISKQLALEFARRTLIQCQIFEETGRSCFSESPMQDVLFSVSSHSIDSKYLHAPGGSTSGLTSTSLERQVQKHEFLLHQGLSNMPVQAFGKADPFFNRAKKKEALLDDVVTSTASRAASTPYNTAPVGPKWKKSDKEKDHARDVQVKSSGPKVGRPSLSGGRGDRKNKTKPKQKIAQLSTSGNGLARPCETSSEITTNGGASANRLESQPRNGANPDFPKDLEDSIFTNLPINGIDEIDVAEGLGGQGQDIGSWLNVDEDLLQGHDLVGLEIPMDDLSDLKLTF
ncbi:hypothetical protein KSP39_PZI011460 [Platanthera zijinensis]|uniref:Uncharacterized protein n=1 Tax=Platanthera zijinensis TaxID=2320716 RepID=A0AAP0BHI7_9ASPA